MFPFWKDWQLQFLFPLDSQVWWGCEKERRSRLRRWELYTEKIRNHIGLRGFFLFLQFLKHFLFILPPFRLFWCVLHHMPQCLMEQVTSFDLKPQQFLGFLAFLNPTKGIQRVFFLVYPGTSTKPLEAVVKLVVSCTQNLRCDQKFIGSAGRRFDHSKQIPIMVQLMNSCIVSLKTKSSSNKS